MILRTNATLAAGNITNAAMIAVKILAILAMIITTDLEDKISGISDAPDIPVSYIFPLILSMAFLKSASFQITGTG